MLHHTRLPIGVFTCVGSLGLLWSSIVFASPASAQELPTLENSQYLRGVARTVDSLLVATYVLPTEAEQYATEFRQRYTSGAYDSVTNPAEFAQQVTADLIAWLAGRT